MGSTQTLRFYVRVNTTPTAGKLPPKKERENQPIQQDKPYRVQGMSISLVDQPQGKFNPLEGKGRERKHNASL